jgi:flagellar biosynthesis regulator FlbT
MNACVFDFCLLAVSAYVRVSVTAGHKIHVNTISCVSRSDRLNVLSLQVLTAVLLNIQVFWDVMRCVYW